jgi:nitrogen fixation/metabolism regulation signal transduction histidine kinase
MALLLYYALLSRQYLRAIYVAVLIVVLLVELFYYVDRRNHDLTRFLEALDDGDSTVRLRDHKMGRSFSQLYRKMNAISEKFQTLRTDRELQFQYTRALLEHVKVGIISFDNEGRIHLVNQSFRDFFHATGLRSGMHIAALEPGLLALLEAIHPEERRVHDVQDNDSISHAYVIQATEFRLGDRMFKLVSAQSIRQELDDHEIVAWQKLIRILTHEIMNSVTPVASLSGSLYEMVRKGIPETDTDQIRKKLEQGLGAIQDRSQGLMHFTEAYKALTRIPPPRMTSIQSSTLKERIDILHRSLLKERNIQFDIEHAGDAWSFKGDLVLLDMVILNLVQNAMEAMESTENPWIQIRVSQSSAGQTQIEFRDNGKGMEKEVLNQIYVPFFTTKSKGSGVGLSISNQIVRSMGGYIGVQSKPGEGSVFTVVL